ncbi:uncharacterized protein FOMMEDRAFT_158888 [Fomitiporia mediterranea MF3/22]|uniref:uncharacterized protein n=1 Tax=Fomitiporia mediterranea (strain MF3/22) TaxID=694068 RepID=UPI00044097FC|nr:uncharacterized protein FOMMEDRAFT_158888 [Fomitiporia mediterranea MF3/22]EJD01732.1 hypothetical protein FOMMEDRAFT_158888 [Fomitiporia mediterranea MF3/22]
MRERSRFGWVGWERRKERGGGGQRNGVRWVEAFEVPAVHIKHSEVPPGNIEAGYPGFHAPASTLAVTKKAHAWRERHTHLSVRRKGPAEGVHTRLSC